MVDVREPGSRRWHRPEMLDDGKEGILFSKRKKAGVGVNMHTTPLPV